MLFNQLCPTQGVVSARPIATPHSSLCWPILPIKGQPIPPSPKHYGPPPIPKSDSIRGIDQWTCELSSSFDQCLTFHYSGIISKYAEQCLAHMIGIDTWEKAAITSILLVGPEWKWIWKLIKLRAEILIAMRRKTYLLVSNSCAPFHAAAAVNNWLATCQPQCPTCMSGDSFQCLTQCIYVCVCLWFVVQVDTASENVPHCQMRHIGKCPGWGWGGERVMRCECSPPQWLIHPCTCLLCMVGGWLKGDAGCILYNIQAEFFN